MIVLAILGLIGYLFYSQKNQNSALNSFNAPVIYKNLDYGFSFYLPSNWQGYSIITKEWSGVPLKNEVTQAGSKIIIRNPKWTASTPYEDLPLLIFTISQWESYVADEFSIGAAPIRASELGRNNKYVFALPARWDFDYSVNYKEAQDIFLGKPLRTFDIKQSQ